MYVCAVSDGRVCMCMRAHVRLSACLYLFMYVCMCVCTNPFQSQGRRGEIRNVGRDQVSVWVGCMCDEGVRACVGVGDRCLPVCMQASPHN